MTTAPDPVLSVRDLRVDFTTLQGVTRAVRGVSFDLPRGKTLALVGESGSGKSVTSYSILRLIQKPGEITGGRILLRPKPGTAGREIDIAALHPKSPELFAIRGGRISMIFQEPMTALSPVHTVGDQITEAVLLHRDADRKQAIEIAADMLARVGITDVRRRLNQYPFEFSGGMRQRVVIAMALVCRPEVLIADEPTTALDVTVQAQILRLINELREQLHTSVLFITHDLGVVAQVADEVAVMRHGRIVELASSRDLFKMPLHPYTRELLTAASLGRERHFPPTESLVTLPDGWHFAPPTLPPTHPLSLSATASASADGVCQIHEVAPGRRLLLWKEPPAP